MKKTIILFMIFSSLFSQTNEEEYAKKGNIVFSGAGSAHLNNLNSNAYLNISASTSIFLLSFLNVGTGLGVSYSFPTDTYADSYSSIGWSVSSSIYLKLGRVYPYIGLQPSLLYTYYTNYQGGRYIYSKYFQVELDAFAGIDVNLFKNIVVGFNFRTPLLTGTVSQNTINILGNLSTSTGTSTNKPLYELTFALQIRLFVYLFKNYST